MKRVVSFIMIAMLLMSIVGCGSKEEKVSINVFNWGDYIDESVIAEFEEETGILVNYETFDTNEAMYTKVKQGGTNYDVCFSIRLYDRKMISEDMLYEIDQSNLSNFGHVMDEFKDLAFDPSSTYSVPYLWGTVGILYNTKVVEEPVDSWNVFGMRNIKATC